MTETEIQKEILDWLNNRGFFCWRHSNMPTRGRRNLTNMPKGMPDIFVFSAGKLVGLEVKTREGKLSPEQVDFGHKLERFGGYWFVCYSLQDVIEYFAVNKILTPVIMTNKAFDRHTGSE